MLFSYTESGELSCESRNHSCHKKHKDIPVKSMSKGTLDRLFYLLKYDFSTTFQQFMDNIGNIKFEYAPGYKPSDQPWFPRYSSSYAQQGQKQLGAYEGFINECKFIVLEQMVFFLSKKLKILNDKFMEDKTIHYSKTCSLQTLSSVATSLLLTVFAVIYLFHPYIL